MVVVVSDTSPIRALAHLDLLHILPPLFDDILIPPAVESELANPPGSLARVDVSQLDYLHVRPA